MFLPDELVDQILCYSSFNANVAMKKYKIAARMKNRRSFEFIIIVNEEFNRMEYVIEFTNRFIVDKYQSYHSRKHFLSTIEYDDWQEVLIQISKGSVVYLSMLYFHDEKPRNLYLGHQLSPLESIQLYLGIDAFLKYDKQWLLCDRLNGIKYNYENMFVFLYFDVDYKVGFRYSLYCIAEIILSTQLACRIFLRQLLTVNSGYYNIYNNFTLVQQFHCTEFKFDDSWSKGELILFELPEDNSFD